jgi:hypothetical protein
MASNRKYIFDENGKPIINPQYQANTTQPVRPVMNPNALTIVSTMDDQLAMAQLTNLGVPKQFQDTINTIQSAPYIAGFQTENLDSGMLMNGLMQIFAQNEIPIGLMSKLTPLQGAMLHFKIDDSGSMANESNLFLRDAHWLTKQNIDPRRQVLTRWEEAEDRMHTLIDLLAYVPTGPIIISFFDHPGQPGARITLDRRGKLPANFLQEAHAAIRSMFLKKPIGSTPILLNMTNMLYEANNLRAATDCRTMHYLLTDGEPNGGADEIDQIKNLLTSTYRFPSSNPFTFLGCSKIHRDYAWMHEVEEVAPFVAALPDFRDESLEVKRDQGNAFPYTRGVWLLCNVAASINPDDLDALDQHAPLTKVILENLLGRGLTEPEYRQYFNWHPNAARVFAPDYNLFLTAQYARDIPSVQLFLNTLAQGLKRDMDDDNDDTEDLEVKLAEQAVINSRRRAAIVTPATVSVTQVPGTIYARTSTRPSSYDFVEQNRQYRRKGCCLLV